MALLMLDVIAAYILPDRPAKLIGGTNSLGSQKRCHPSLALPQQRRGGGSLRHPGCVPHSIQCIAKIPEHLRIYLSRKQRLLQRFQLDDRSPQPLCNSRA